ncbi:MAG: hypothetical protein ACFFBZ_04765 [Promethearchaeota archaeon]
MLAKNCIKCGKSEVKIINYYYARTSGEFGDVQTTVGRYIPVCEFCAKEFDRYRKQKENLKNAGSFFICLFILSGFWGFIWLFHPDFNALIFIPMCLSIIFAIITVFLFTSIIASPDRISRYFKLKKDGTIIIKNENWMVKTEIEYYIKEEFNRIVNEDSFIKCPKCGALGLTHQDFCNFCGKDLRMLKN